MKKLVSTLFITVLIIISLPSATSAYKNQDSINKNWVTENKLEIAEEFEKLGINKVVQNKLINKLENGQLIDSMKPENIEKINQKAATLSMNDSITHTYPDGSKAIIGQEEVINDGPMLLIAAGTHTIKSYYYSGLVNMDFKTDFTTRKGAYDSIIRSYGESASVIGGSLDSESLTTPRKNETKTYRAYSKYKIKYTVINGWISSTFDLYFHVGNNSYESKLSLADRK